jgi:glycosyltransferase involved in cell wall biosynthesis
MATTAAIVCAYNEASRIGSVLRTLTSYSGFSEVVVVDDGSTDHTAWVAAAFPVRVIEHRENLGKGVAMATGAQATNASVLFFCDADIQGLTESEIAKLIAPVSKGALDMMIAQRDSPFYALPGVVRITPHLSGVRAVSRGLWNRVPRFYKRRFMIEAALNYFADKGRGLDIRIVRSLRQTVKERKYGFMKGMAARIRMVLEVLYAYVQLRIKKGE